MSTSLLVPGKTLDGERFVRTMTPDIRRKSYGGPTLSAKAEEPNRGDRYARNVPITSEHVDSDGDIIRADGLDVESRYKRNPIVQLQHGRTMEFPVIGGNAIVQRGMVDGVPGWIATEWLFGDTVLGREINSLWNDMILRTTSIGFKPIEWRYIDSNGMPVDPLEPNAWDRVTGFEFTKTILYEFSVVAIPANPHASRELGGLLGMKAAAYFDLGALKAACSGCGGQAKVAADRIAEPFGQIVAAVREATTSAAGLVAAPPALADLARTLKGVSLERCPGCGGVNLYSRDAKAFLEHRSPAGAQCRAPLGIEPQGPTLKTIADAIRDKTRSESPLTRTVPAEAATLLEALVAAADVASLHHRFGAVLTEVAECIKAGRVLSAETRRTIGMALDQIESAGKQTGEAIDAMRGAAGALREFLAAADRDDSDEAKASAAGRKPEPKPQDPALTAALLKLSAALA